MFHYVVAGMSGLFGLFPIIHLAIGVLMVSGAFKQSNGEGPPAFVGIFFIVVALLVMALAWSLAILLFMAARRLAARRSYTFCMICAGVSCAFMPFGTVLGVFTIIVLSRPSVKQLFATVP